MAKKTQKNGRLFVIIVLILTAILLGITYLILLAYGEKSGVEFSPDDFSMREFNYSRLPLINWTKRGIKYSDVKNDTASMLINDDWIRSTGRKPKRWQLVRESGGFSSASAKIPAECDARFLTDYFDLTNDDGDIYVVKWTDENPNSARVFWPLVAEMARGDLYLPMPEIFEFVLDQSKADDNDSFTTELRQRVAESWYQAGLTDQLTENHERAVERFDAAISVDESHTMAQEAKLESEAASR